MYHPGTILWVWQQLYPFLWFHFSPSGKMVNVYVLALLPGTFKICILDTIQELL